MFGCVSEFGWFLVRCHYRQWWSWLILTANLVQRRIIWKEILKEELSRSSWLCLACLQVKIILSVGSTSPLAMP